MTQMHNTARPRLVNGWRIAGWGALLAIFMIPVILAPLTSEMTWTRSDYLFAAIMLGTVGMGFEIAVRVTHGKAHTVGMGIAILTGFFTVWSNAAVGIIGSEDEAVNLGFYALVFAGVAASALVWFRPRPMAWIVAAIAAGQPMLGLVAHATMPGHQVEWGILAFFAVLWSLAAYNFARAASARALG